MSSESERWLWAPGYEGLYMVSSLGRIMGLPKKTHKGHLLKLKTTRAGYIHVCLCKGNIKKDFSVHRLVAMAFIPNKEGKKEVNHINGNRADNRVQNLEWCTRSENERHAYRALGKKPNTPWKDKPRKCARRFSDDQVRRIRKDKRSSPVIAREHGVSKTTIRDIKIRKNYKEVI